MHEHTYAIINVDDGVSYLICDCGAVVSSKYLGAGEDDESI